MKEKKFKLVAHEIKQLIEPMGACMATDKITVDGLPVMYMYRDTPIRDVDSGWRFFAGGETEEYLNNTGNSGIYDVNTIANHDPSIIPYLDMPYDIKLEKNPTTGRFNIITD